MDNKHRKLFVIQQSKRCKFMPKMHQNMLCAPPDLLPAMEFTSMGREGKRLLTRGRGKGRRPTSKGSGKEGREKRGRKGRGT